MKEIYVVNCCRTAIGSFGGSLKDTPATELGAVVVKEVLNRAGVKPEQSCSAVSSPLPCNPSKLPLYFSKHSAIM